MESATLRRAPPLPGLAQLGLIGLLVGLAAVAWAITNDRMAGMDTGPGTDLGGLGFFIGVWVVMMAAMMFPSIAPMVVMYARMQEGRRSAGEAVAGSTALFVVGYLVAWTAAGLAAYGVFELGRAATGDLFSWDNAGPYLAGGVVLAAAVYQLTPLKDVCLRHCRSPLGFLMQHWTPGRIGAVRMGVIHGGWCVGCCWALMAALIAVEKLLPWRAPANRGIAVLLLALGVMLLASPASVPGLTIPGSPKAMRAMDRMGGGGSMMNGESMNGESMNGESMNREPMNREPPVRGGGPGG
jgi:predicted metal-binding integral membrane protein DUF2182